jgi:hypothetical protein
MPKHLQMTIAPEQFQSLLELLAISLNTQTQMLLLHRLLDRVAQIMPEEMFGSALLFLQVVQ